VQTRLGEFLATDIIMHNAHFHLRETENCVLSILVGLAIRNDTNAG